MPRPLTKLPLTLTSANFVSHHQGEYKNIFLILFTPVMTVCKLSISFLLHHRLKKTKSSGASEASQVPSAQQANQVPTTGSTQGSASTKNRYIKPAVSMLILVFAMVICMLPYCLYVMIIQLFCETCNTLVVIYAIFLLQFCIACLDPFLYGMNQKKTRFYCSCFNNRIQPT